MSEEIIKIEHVSKEYRLGMIGGTTLRDELQRKAAKIRGKEDPTRKVTDTSAGNAGERFLALDDINLTINKGERVGIIGHNGAGKSTLLKLLSRITAPSRGSIELNGRIASMLEVGTGFHGELSGRENIYMNGAILGMSRAEIDAKMEDIIDFSECRQFIDTPVKRYSSGMYVKLAFSVAAHLDSEIMIMDEVLAVGDMQFQKKCLDKMSQVSQTEGRTILYVSHNMNTIRQLCDRCIVLDHGKLIFDGEVEHAIDIYSGYSGNQFPLFYDLSDIKRPSDFHGKFIHMNSLEFVGRQQAIFERTKPMEFSIDFDSRENISGLKLYFIVLSDKDERIGLAQTYSSVLNVEKDKKYKCKFSIDLSNLSTGNYYFIPDLFSDDGNGKHCSYDNANRRIYFKMIDDNTTGLDWNSRYYGHIWFNPVNTVSAEEIV